MKALSGLDAAFLYLETPTSPMHVAGLTIIDGSLTFEKFRELLAQRIHMVPAMRQRLVSVPLSIDRPYWIDDPEFHLDWHIHHTALPAPGDWATLRKLCSRIFSQPLGRNKPLWEMVFVEGLDNIQQIPPGSVGVIAKMHHAAIDGMSAVDILGMLFDLTPEPRDIDPPKESTPPPIPGELELVMRSTLNLAARPKKLPGILMETVRASVKSGMISRTSRVEAPTLPFTAPHTPFNQPISPERLWNTSLISLDRVKRIKDVVGCTVNDVVLGICGGALRRYLEEKGLLPQKPLVAMVPVSTRTADQKNTGGNMVSPMFVRLGTDEEDPVARLRSIMGNTQRGKAVQNGVDANRLVEYSEFVPFGLAGQAARFYSRTQLAKRHRPIFNCVITNVPGPQVTMYLNGSPVLAHMGSAPIMDGMGLMIAVLSYNGVISISPTSSPQVMPDLDTFNRYLRESANELEEHVLKLEEAEVHLEEQRYKDDIGDIFLGMAERLRTDESLHIPVEGLYAFEIIMSQEQTWIFDLRGDQKHIRKAEDGEHVEVTCVLKMEPRHFVRLAAGEMDGAAAFMSGKLQIDGDINDAINFGKDLAVFSEGNTQVFEPPTDSESIDNEKVMS